MVPLGFLGVSLGIGDLTNGSELLGLAEIFGGIVLGLYGIRGAVVDAQRITNPVRLVIARDGFELFPGRRRFPWFELYPSQHPVSWDDVATVSDPKSPAGQPRNLRVQLYDPAAFADRENLSALDRLLLRLNGGDLVLGIGMALSVSEVEQLMRQHLAEFRRPGSASVPAAARTATPKARRPARKR
jgi:hypothetical protein